MITRVEELWTLAKAGGREFPLVLAGSENPPALETVSVAQQRGLIRAILVGDPEQTATAAQAVGVDLKDFEFLAAADHAEAVDASLSLIRDGEAEILMKGQVPTRTMLKGLLNRKYGLRTERLLSHVSVFNVPGEQRVLIITDAGVNVTPDVTKKRDIVLNAVELAHILGNPRPKVAMLSFVEEATDRQVRLTADADGVAGMYRHGEITGCVVEGPYSLDVALSKEAAELKGVTGEVAGQADILVMHDIGMGNVLYKALLLWCNPTIAGVIMGSRVPINVCSRADSMNTKLNSVALAVMAARHSPVPAP
ncbi:MAG TPA: phosphate acyltransferase [Phycisphaerae bacterium]|nr:phosphate acyltransferase [Phycisphaerae bacterium]